jgi:hypothetical protein
VKIKFKLLLAFMIIALAGTTAFAQKKDSVGTGAVTGILRDSVHNYIMQSATMAIYKVAGNELVNYQLTNNFGRFQFKQVPVGIPLRIIATHVGYMSAKKDFIISPKTKTIDLKVLNMERIDLSLKEVTIAAAAPPMQMHGDTLEFNASAFKLDTNAVVEDLLRKLPGVTVWADGVITVNGRKISRLLVDGKDFFGGDNKIALQNIPKNAVQKIQVYQNRDDKNNIAPPTEMNIVLKKNKKDGFFGKFGAGLGTQQHYAGDGMITYFSPKTQANIVGAYNNVNKSANDVNTLMGFNSFKGEGINNDYHSDFTRQGQNVFKGGGFTASHDFSSDADTRPAYYKTNLLKGEFFLSDASNNTIAQSQSKTSLGANGNINQTSNGTSVGDNYSDRGSVNYDKRLEHYSISSSFNFNDSRSNSVNTQDQRSINDLTSQQTHNLAQQISTSSQTSASGNASLTTNRYFDFGKHKYKSLNMYLTYGFNLGDGTRNSQNITDFKATDATQNKYFNRQYLTDFNSNTHTINVSFRDIGSYFRKYSQPFVTMDIKNSLDISDYHENTNVGDLTVGGASYTPNAGLTNISHYKTIDEKPTLSFNKSHSKGLDNRFYKSWSASVSAQGQAYMQRNSALQSFQNLDRTYHYFIPTANFSFYNDQYGDYTSQFSLNYSTNVHYPTVSQLTPLNDNANVYSISLGNPNLQPAYEHNLTFYYNYYQQGGKNAINGNVNLTASLTKRNMTDSTNYDALGRYIRTVINLGDKKYISYSGSIHKSYKIKEQQFNISGNSGLNYSDYLTSVNGQTYQTHTTGVSASYVLLYNYQSLWSAGAGEYFSGNKTSQGSLSHSTYYNWTTNFGFAFAFPKSIFFNTRVNFNNSKSSAVANNVYYTIWNADVGYRFLKGAEAEIKLSALDILHQNRSIYNYAYGNTIGTNTANVLQQYFMLTLAYYPRKFGLKK